MPLDQSIIFDGAWRIISGQVPFRDFNTPNSISPILLQVPFFKLFGLNWFVYCLHAATFNGIFCLLVFFFLRMLGGSRLVSFFYAFLSGLIFYPPFGTPYQDQHSFFFVMLALVVAIFPSRSQVPFLKVTSWVLLPAIMVAAYFSKQIPTVFAVPFVFFILLATTKKNQLRSMLTVNFASLIGIMIIFIAVFKTLKMNFVQMKLYFFRLPLQMGMERLKFFISQYSIPKMLKGLFYPLPLDKFSLNLHSFSLVYVSAFVILAITTISHLRIFIKIRKINDQGIYLKIFLSIALLVICNLFIFFTLNQGENGIPFLFVSLGLMNIVCLSLLPPQTIKRRKAILRYALSAFFMFVAVLDAVSFNNNVNKTRFVHDFKLGTRPKTSSAKLPAGLEFVDFAMPPQYRFRPEALKRVTDFFKEEKVNFFLLGDTSILYGLARRPSVNPSLWFHPGLTIPASDSDDFRLYEERLLENIQKYKVKYLVLEGDRTWFNISLNNFKKLQALIRENSVENKTFGQFRVLRIDFHKKQ